MSDVQLSAHFRLSEFAISDAYPELVVPVPTRYQPQLRKLVDTVLEPLRGAFGAPIRVLSGYRSFRLNATVGGSPTSQHLYAEAADLTPTMTTVGRRRPALALFDLLRANALPHGQAIWYPDRNFVHVALPSVRYPAPTFCVHLPARGLVYRVVERDTDVKHLAGLAA
jgi:uncharacterized protein YcbK (DUF882 family)